MIYGYVRVSTKDQNAARQISALMNEGVDEKNLFVDRKSGKDFQRKRYQSLLRKIKPGDVIFIKELDRLGRNYLGMPNDEFLDPAQWRCTMIWSAYCKRPSVWIF